MRQRNTFILLSVVVVVLTLSAVYAAITNIQLSVQANVTATPDQANFKVGFTGTPTYSGTGTATANITSDTTATINVSGLSSVGDSQTTTFTVGNTSKDITAYLGCTATNNNTEYFKVTTNLGSTSIAPAGGTATVAVTVELIKTPITANVTDTVNVTVTASPTELGNLISFAIDGVTYQAEYGMTWGMWIESEYNTSGLITNGSVIYYAGGVTSVYDPSPLDGVSYRPSPSTYIRANYDDYWMSADGGLM